MGEKQNPDTQEEALLFLELSKMVYQIEEKREESFTLQASRMQSAFSFVIAAIAMLISPIISDNNGSLPFVEIYAMFASIIALLLLSLLFATIAQRRRKRNLLIDPEKLEQEISSKWHSEFDGKAVRAKTLGKMLLKMVPDYRKNNDRICNWLLWSRVCFYFAMIVSIVWFVVITVQLIFL